MEDILKAERDELYNRESNTKDENLHFLATNLVTVQRESLENSLKKPVSDNRSTKI